LAQAKGRSGFLWWLLSLFLGPIATFLIVVLPPIPKTLKVIYLRAFVSISIRIALVYHRGCDACMAINSLVGGPKMKALLNLVAVAAILGTTAVGYADGPGAKSPELQVLDRYVGTWDETVVIKPAQWTPEKTTSSTTTTRQWILNGRMTLLNIPQLTLTAE
jgi:hypothetical protein